MNNKLFKNTQFQDYTYVILGIFFATFALNGMLVPNGFLDGGMTGISLLISHSYHLPLSIIIVLVNIPFVIMGYYQVGKHFAVNTLISIILLGLSLQFLPIGNITSEWENNKILIALFGGFFIGLGIGLCMRAGFSIDGIEILALFTKKRIGLTMSELILGLNVVIFLIAALEFGLEKAFYAILTYFIATRTIDYVVEGIEEFTGLTIISEHSERIKEVLVKDNGRGISIYKGERGFLKNTYEVSYDCDIVFTIVTRLEVRKLKQIIYDIDPKAFIFTNTIKEASGGVLSKKPKH